MVDNSRNYSNFSIMMEFNFVIKAFGNIHLVAQYTLVEEPNTPLKQSRCQ